MTKYLILFSSIIAVILSLVFHQAILAFLQIIGVIIAATLTGAGLITLVYGWLLAAERLRRERARRQLEEWEREAKKFRDYQDGFGMVHLLNLESGVVENLSTYPGSHHNGTWEEPPANAMLAWHALVARNKEATREVVAQLPASVAPPVQPLDLLSVFTQPTQSYAIIAGQQVGKTYQAQRIANHWLQTGFQPVVIGPKWDAGEWNGCQLYGGEYDFGRVAEGMQRIAALAHSRHADKDRTHKEHSIQPVFFDDWTATRAKLPDQAEAFIIDATTLYASVNVILYFIIHLDTANAWGVGRIGAALHQNFIKLRIEPGFDSQGMIDRSKNTGWLIMPGQSHKRDWRRVALFGGMGQQALLPDLIFKASDKVSDKEARIIQMIQDGAADSDIAKEVFGKPNLVGGNFYKVKELRERFTG